MNNTNLKTVNGKDVLVSDTAALFTLHKQASTYVDYFGTDKSGQRMFFQFNNGTCFMLTGVPAEVQDAAVAAPSIGKFWHSTLKGKYETEQLMDKSVEDVPATDEEEFIGDDDIFN